MSFTITQTTPKAIRVRMISGRGRNHRDRLPGRRREIGGGKDGSTGVPANTARTWLGYQLPSDPCHCFSPSAVTRQGVSAMDTR
jgi:hypothetical protein